jgi:hypothetical protein
MKVGDQIRVKNSVVIYHHPEQRNQPYDLKGLEGEIVALANEWKGKAISANLPLQVKFSGKLRAHLREDELELLASP